MFTYAIADGVAIKIGRSEDPRARLKQLQTGNPRQLEVIGFIVGDHEQRVHRFLSDSQANRCVGEWFADEGWTRTLLRDFGFQIDVPGLPPQNSEVAGDPSVDHRRSIEEGGVYGLGE